MQNEISTSLESQQPIFTPSEKSDNTFDCLVMRRNGKVTPFDQSKIMVAITKAFLAVEGSSAAASARVHENVEKLTQQVVKVLLRRLPENSTIHIEDIQDQVELALMREGHHKVARAYVLYRAARADERKMQQTEVEDETGQSLHVTMEDGSRKPLDMQRLQVLLDEATNGLKGVDQQALQQAIERNLFDGMKEADYRLALVMSARSMIEQDPTYSQVAARILLDNMRHEALSFVENMPTYASQQDMQSQYAEYFPAYIHKAVELELVDEELTRYDLQALGQALQADNDHAFNYLGLQTLYDRYFIHSGKIRFELPQAFFMRVAMGLAINEVDREA
jgi:ribonucleoside-diphosphate reductase alpha chain